MVMVGGLLVVAPRLIMSPAQKYASSMVRIFSGAKEEGGLARLSSFSAREKPLPSLPYAQADKKLRVMAATSDEICIFDLFAVIATAMGT